MRNAPDLGNDRTAIELKAISTATNVDVSPKDKSPEIQCDPIASAAFFGGRQIQEVDGNRQQPKKQTNDHVFAPAGLHNDVLGIFTKFTQL